MYAVGGVNYDPLSNIWNSWYNNRKGLRFFLSRTSFCEKVVVHFEDCFDVYDAKTDEWIQKGLKYIQYIFDFSGDLPITGFGEN